MNRPAYTYREHPSSAHYFPPFTSSNVCYQNCNDNTEYYQYNGEHFEITYKPAVLFQLFSSIPFYFFEVISTFIDFTKSLHG